MALVKNMTTLEEEISAGEGKKLELKAEFSEDRHSFLKTVVAFANTSSGKMVIGVREDRKVIGIPDDEIFGLMDSIADCINASCHPQLIPDIFPATVNGKNVIVVEINESGARPYYLKSEGVLRGTYVRIGATSVLASPEVIDDLRMSGKNRSFDEQICNDLEATDDRISEVCTLLGKQNGRKFTKTDLLNMKLLIQSGDEIHATNAFALLCNENPFLHASIRCGLFKKDRSIVLDRKEYGGSVIKQAEEAQNFVLANIRVGMELNGLYRKDVFEIPKDALREALLNLLIHRNYMLHESASFVSVYDDKVEILSPGMLPWGMDMEKIMSGRSAARNRVIAHAFKAAGLIESFGTGIRKMQRLCEEQGCPAPEIKENGIDFIVTFFREPAGNGTPVAQNVKDMTGAESRVYAMVCGDSAMTIKDMSVSSGISEMSVRRILNSFIEKGLIIREGSNKAGRWVRK